MIPKTPKNPATPRNPMNPKSPKSPENLRRHANPKSRTNPRSPRFGLTWSLRREYTHRARPQEIVKNTCRTTTTRTKASDGRSSLERHAQLRDARKGAARNPKESVKKQIRQTRRGSIGTSTWTRASSQLHPNIRTCGLIAKVQVILIAVLAPGGPPCARTRN